MKRSGFIVVVWGIAVRLRGHSGLRLFQKTWFAIALIVWALGACVSARETASENVTPETSRPTPRSNASQQKKTGFDREPTAREYKIIQELMVESEKIRGLTFIRPVPVQIQDRAAITAYVESQIEEKELEKARSVYTALGLLSPNLDIRSLLLRVLGEQILGYYDPKTNKLVVRDDVIRGIESGEHDSSNPLMDEARIDLVHELVHSLQSQHLSLSENIDLKRDNDAENAYRSLIEGDATLAMIGYMLKKQQPDAQLNQLTGNPKWIRALASMIDQMPVAGPELANAPEIVRVPLLSAYVDGLAFVANLHAQNGWQAVNAAHRSPPTSTEQILHPERFLRGDLPNIVKIPDLPALVREGYELVDEDTLGELEMRVYFAQTGKNDAAERAAEGWGWDRLRLYRKNNETSTVIWFTTWDDENEAKEAAASAREVLSIVPQGKRDRFDVAWSGRTVLIIRELPPHLHREVLDTWREWNTLLSSSDASDGEN
jgi:hypothetical protein